MFAKIKVALGVAVASAMSLSSLVFQPQIAIAANETFDSKADYAASFNGVNAYGVTGGPVIPASGDYTVEAWVYNDGGDAMREIVAQGDDTANFYMGDIWGDMRVAGAGDLPKSKKAQWYHLAVTKSDSGAYIWVNGQ
jgi:hypothetical protein